MNNVIRNKNGLLYTLTPKILAFKCCGNAKNDKKHDNGTPVEIGNHKSTCPLAICGEMDAFGQIKLFSSLNIDKAVKELKTIQASLRDAFSQASFLVAFVAKNSDASAGKPIEAPSAFAAWPTQSVSKLTTAFNSSSSRYYAVTIPGLEVCDWSITVGCPEIIYPLTDALIIELYSLRVNA